MAENVKIPPGFGGKYLLVCIDEAGSKVEAFGYEGQTCKAATKPFLEALAGKVVEDKAKAAEAVVRVKA